MLKIYQRNISDPNWYDCLLGYLVDARCSCFRCLLNLKFKIKQIWVILTKSGSMCDSQLPRSSFLFAQRWRHITLLRQIFFIAFAPGELTLKWPHWVFASWKEFCCDQLSTFYSTKTRNKINNVVFLSGRKLRIGLKPDLTINMTKNLKPESSR